MRESSRPTGEADDKVTLPDGAAADVEPSPFDSAFVAARSPLRKPLAIPYHYLSASPANFYHVWGRQSWEPAWEPATVDGGTQPAPVQGWKVARLVYLDGAVRFQGVGMGGVYDARAEARCVARHVLSFVSASVSIGSWPTFAPPEPDHHPVPDPWCGCGFYILADLPTMHGIADSYRSTVTTRVEGWGENTIEYGEPRQTVTVRSFGGGPSFPMPIGEWPPATGWRCRYQRVLDVWVKPRCVYCSSSQPMGVTRRNDGVYPPDETGASEVVPVCADCDGRLADIHEYRAWVPAEHPQERLVWTLGELSAALGVPCHWGNP